MRINIVAGNKNSGKTTAIIQASRFLNDEGKTVAVIAEDDEKYLAGNRIVSLSPKIIFGDKSPFTFCSDNASNDQLELLVSNIHPDYIFIEYDSDSPQIAKIDKSNLQILIDKTDFEPTFSVFIDSKTLINNPSSFKPENESRIFSKQSEEAGLIVMNRIDLLEQTEFARLFSFANHRFRGRNMISQNSNNLQNIQNWILTLESIQSRKKKRVFTAPEIEGFAKRIQETESAGQNRESILFIRGNAEKHKCCCGDECLCEKYAGDESFVCPCRTSDGTCCCC